MNNNNHDPNCPLCCGYGWYTTFSSTAKYDDKSGFFYHEIENSIQKICSCENPKLKNNTDENKTT